MASVEWMDLPNGTRQKLERDANGAIQQCPRCGSYERKKRFVVEAHSDAEGPALGDCIPMMSCSDEWHNKGQNEG